MQMTDEVAALVLRNNYLQSQAISMGELQSRERLSESAYVIRALERSGDLNRALEFLPSDEEIAERRKAGEGLTRPELAVDLELRQDLAVQGADPLRRAGGSLSVGRARRAISRRRYSERFAARVKRHRLRREIIATAITNSLINRMGPVFPVRAQDDTGAEPAAIARAYTIAREVFAVRDIWTQIEALDNRIPAAVQYDAMSPDHTAAAPRDLLAAGKPARRPRHRARGAALCSRKSRSCSGLTGVAGAVEQARLRVIAPASSSSACPTSSPPASPRWIRLYCSLDLVEAATVRLDADSRAAPAYFDIGERIGLAWIKDQIESLPAEGHWQAVARGTLSDNLYELQRKITAAALAGAGGGPVARVDAWIGAHAAGVDYLKRVVMDLRSAAAADFATLSVARGSREAARRSLTHRRCDRGTAEIAALCYIASMGAIGDHRAGKIDFWSATDRAPGMSITCSPAGTTST